MDQTMSIDNAISLVREDPQVIPVTLFFLAISGYVIGNIVRKICLELWNRNRNTTE